VGQEGLPRGSDTLSATQVFCLPMHHDLSDEHFRIAGRGPGEGGDCMILEIPESQ
jgi:hypothetical protein